MKGRIQIGEIQSFITYNRQYTQPLGQIAQVLAQLQTMVAAAERVLEFLGEEEEEDVTTNPVDINSLNGDIKFDHVKFGYYPGNLVIKDFTCDVKTGQKIAIVGPTGAGKTTIVKLLMRFYNIDYGKILIDGHNIQEFSKGDLRTHFGMVLQD